MTKLSSSPHRPKRECVSLGTPYAGPSQLACALAPGDPQEKGIHPHLVAKYRDGEFHQVRDLCAQEEELDVIVQGQDGFSLSRTPGDDNNLVIGSLFTRSRINSAQEVAEVRYEKRAGQDVAEVRLSDGPQFERRLCPLQDTRRERIRPESLMALCDAFEGMQVVRRRTGATHGAALFDMKGVPLAFGEDVGRHNAMDKSIGSVLTANLLDQAAVVLLSSRLAVELVLKAVSCSVPILAGFSVATAAAVECADSYGITLVGRMRPTSMNVYTHSWRLV